MKKNLLNLKMAVIGMGMLFSTAANAATFTAALSGNWSSSATWGGSGPTGLLSGDNIIIPSGITVTMDMDVTFTSSLLLANTFSVNGVLTNNTNNGLTITQGVLTGNGTISVKRLTFTNTGSALFTGNMNVGTLVNSNSSLAFTSMANVADSLILESGVLNLNTGGNLSLAANSTIRVNNGSVAIGGSGIFNASNAHNVMYMGTSKTSGLELSGATVTNLTIHMSNNNQSVTLGGDYTINGNISFNNGKLNMNGRKLTLMGDLNMNSSNSIMSNSTSELVINGTGSLSSGLVFESGSSINNMTINRSGSTVKLMSALNVVGHLNLMNGNYSLENGSNLTMNAGSTIHLEGGSLSTNSGNFIGTASYNVEYMGNTNNNSGTELSGSGLNDVTVHYNAGTIKTMLNSNTTINGSLNLVAGSMDMNGHNLTLNGTMSQATTNATFIGNSASELNLNLSSVSSSSNSGLYFDNASHSLSKLNLNLASSSGSNASVMLGTALTIVNELSLNNGRLALSNSGDLVIQSTGSITGYNSNNYIITSAMGSVTTGGHLMMNVASGGSGFVTFPVGTNNNYSPAYVQQTSAGTAGNFMVSTTDGLLADGTSGTDLSTTQSAVKRTWFVEAESGVTVNMNLKLGWMATAEANSFNRSNAILRHYTSGSWDMYAAASASAGANSTFELTRTGLTSLSPFGVTDNSTTVGIKHIAANSISFDVYPNPAKESISVKSPNASATCKYELIDITGRTLFSTSNTESVNKFDISKLDKGYYFIKATDTENNTSGTKRFVKD